MHLDRLTAYLEGGRPPGARLGHPGCRDPRPPARAEPVMLPGLLYFATESLTWTGGRAFYDPDGDGRLPARAYLLTLGQFSDIAAQEMLRRPGKDLDLTDVLHRGRAALGSGRYETLVRADHLDGSPVLTFTAPWRSTDVPLNAPSAAYLRHIAAGIIAAHHWSARRTAEYLAGCPGAAGRWPVAEIEALVTESGSPGPPAGPKAPEGPAGRRRNR
ncbi:histone deacetylase [Streptomyces sp. NPDC053427]|uniref:histone deacetylase n=1 Tax=Streptomyces sp. NPDC053427 TaxID=3365701 RepID=UPI0037D3AA65